MAAAGNELSQCSFLRLRRAETPRSRRFHFKRSDGGPPSKVDCEFARRARDGACRQLGDDGPWHKISIASPAANFVPDPAY
jgi:hypothetical protein